MPFQYHHQETYENEHQLATAQELLCEITVTTYVERVSQSERGMRI